MRFVLLLLLCLSSHSGFSQSIPRLPDVEFNKAYLDKISLAYQNEKFGNACRNIEPGFQHPRMDKFQARSYFETVIKNASLSDITSELDYYEKELSPILAASPRTGAPSGDGKRDFAVAWARALDVMSADDFYSKNSTVLPLADWQIENYQKKILGLRCRTIVNSILRLIRRNSELSYISDLTEEDRYEFIQSSPMTLTNLRALDSYLAAYQRLDHRKIAEFEKYDLNNCVKDFEFATKLYPLLKSKDDRAKLALTLAMGNPPTASHRKALAALQQRKNICQKGSEVDRRKLGPVLDQKVFGHCTFYASHGLLSYELGEAVSIPQLVMQQAKDLVQGLKLDNGIVSRSAFDTPGEVPLILNRFLKGDKQCREKDLPNYDEKNRSQICKIANFSHFLQSTAAIYEEAALRTADKIRCDGIGDMNLNLAKFIAAGVETINKEVATETRIDASFKNCQASIMKKKDFEICDSYAQKSDILSVLDKALDLGKPANMDINGNVFDKSLLTDPRALLSDGHAVLIVDRRWNDENQQCQYLVKNSWSKDWGMKDAIGIENELPTPNGHVWMNESLIRGYAYAARFIHRKKNGEPSVCPKK